MRGKIVGSYSPPSTAFAVWPEGGAYVVVAPSGARMSRHSNHAAAEVARIRKQAEWDETMHPA